MQRPTKSGKIETLSCAQGCPCLSPLSTPKCSSVPALPAVRFETWRGWRFQRLAVRLICLFIQRAVLNQPFSLEAPSALRPPISGDLLQECRGSPSQGLPSGVQSPLSGARWPFLGPWQHRCSPALRCHVKDITSMESSACTISRCPFHRCHS